MVRQGNSRLPSWRAELGLLMLVAWAAFAAIPLTLGQIGLSWDALNHHVYLGWTAEHPRFDRDFLAAAYQSFQYPYLYWPMYKLVQSGISGQWAGVMLVTLNLVAVPPLWLLARTCMPEPGWYAAAMRWLSVILAFMTGVVLSLFDSTSNDLLAATPLVWSVAVAFQPWDPHRPRWLTVGRAVLWSGVFAGVSVAFKLSNGPLAILMPLLWVLHGSRAREHAWNVTLGCLATLAAFVLSYGYWGWQLWSHFGNPLYPFCDPWLAPVRDWLGWHP
jgi:hypothetical protein